MIDTPNDTEPRTGHESKTRAEHLTWCKQRAHLELDADPHGAGPANAAASLASDLGKHPATRGHPGVELLTMQLAGGHLRTPDAVRREIDGFQ